MVLRNVRRLTQIREVAYNARFLRFSRPWAVHVVEAWV